jgi:flagellar biosynthesis chaperone FliJ
MEAILSGKKRFKEIRQQLGLDLQPLQKSDSFLAQLQSLLQQSAPAGLPASELSLPFRRTLTSQQPDQSRGDEAYLNNSEKHESLQKMKKRVEKEVRKQEEAYERELYETKIKALEAVAMA